MFRKLQNYAMLRCNEMTLSYDATGWRDASPQLTRARWDMSAIVKILKVAGPAIQRPRQRLYPDPISECHSVRSK
jgi:hypothetical protein